MDPTLFAQQLALLAHTRAVREPRHSSERATEPQQVHRQGQLLNIDPRNNSTWSQAATRIRQQIRNCEHCEHTVTDQVVTHVLYCYPEKHWRTTCQSCHMTRHPETGLFSVQSRRAQQAFVTWFKTK